MHSGDSVEVYPFGGDPNTALLATVELISLNQVSCALRCVFKITTLAWPDWLPNPMSVDRTTGHPLFFLYREAGAGAWNDIFHYRDYAIKESRSMKAGDRVGAVASSKDGTVNIFGYGVYEGDEVPPPDIMGPFGPMTGKNPKILLDSGEVVWGCECWWGAEEVIRNKIAGMKISEITPTQYRNRE